MFCRGKHAVESAKYGKRKDHVLILAALERVANEIRDSPDETHYLAMIHCLIISTMALELQPYADSCMLNNRKFTKELVVPIMLWLVVGRSRTFLPFTAVYSHPS